MGEVRLKTNIFEVLQQYIYLCSSPLAFNCFYQFTEEGKGARRVHVAGTWQLQNLNSVLTHFKTQTLSAKPGGSGKGALMAVAIGGWREKARTGAEDWRREKSRGRGCPTTFVRGWQFSGTTSSPCLCLLSPALVLVSQTTSRGSLSKLSFSNALTPSFYRKWKNMWVSKCLLLREAAVIFLDYFIGI